MPTNKPTAYSGKHPDDKRRVQDLSCAGAQPEHAHRAAKTALAVKDGKKPVIRRHIATSRSAKFPKC
ncbi:hypothetical protein [Sphingomonas sp. UYEF23]|uniref:hypothetical protein n=1 Tax=Sphingomonas sp. UYEF23 TaxID=1756408 RepID=UPI0033955BD7